MGEVLLAMDLLDASDAERAGFADAMGKRRWTPVRGVSDTYVCFFEHGFIDEVRRIVYEDVLRSARAAALSGFSGAHVWSAVGHRWSGSDDAPARSGAGAAASPPEGAAEVWTDRGGAPVGPVADVLLRLASADGPLGLAPAFGAVLQRRGWRPVAGRSRTFRHAFDLGMFDPIADRVAGDLQAAARSAGVASWRGVYAQSTWECTRVHPPAPRASRPLPWDPDR